MLEYNQEVSDAVNQAFGNSFPNRLLGIRIMNRVDDGYLETVWTNGLVDWSQNATGSCGKYDAWTTADWIFDETPKYTAHVQGSISQGIMPGAILNLET